MICVKVNLVTTRLFRLSGNAMRAAGERTALSLASPLEPWLKRPQAGELATTSVEIISGRLVAWYLRIACSRFDTFIFLKVRVM